jgi:hypothetical protein
MVIWTVIVVMDIVKVLVVSVVFGKNGRKKNKRTHRIKNKSKSGNNGKQLSKRRALFQGEKVEEIKGFYGNLASYIVVNIGLLVLNLVTSPGHFVVLLLMIGWGIGVIIHGMKVFNYMPFLGQDWEQQKIREIMEKESNKRPLQITCRS